MFPTVTKQLLMKCLTTILSKLEIRPVQPLTFLPKNVFPLAITLMKILLPY